MAESKRRDQWEHTSNLLSMLFNVNRDASTTPASSAEDWSPFGKSDKSGKKKPSEKPIPISMAQLHGIFIGAGIVPPVPQISPPPAPIAAAPTLPISGTLHKKNKPRLEV